jgi:hypothetical protein
MYNLPYAYAYALPDMRRIALVLIHILIQSQSSYKSIFSYKTSNDAETSDDAETHMQHSVLHIWSTSLAYGFSWADAYSP